MGPQVFFTTIALVFVTFSGCGNKAKSQSETCDREGYIRDSAEFTATQGEGILAVSSSTPVIKGYFEKPYNRDWLTAVGRASINDTVDFIETTNARVYRADAIAKESARPLSSVRPMPGDIDQEWQHSAKISPQTCGYLVGLYLLKDSANLPSTNANAAVIVREDAGRWTLVHEFMHHNFKTQSAARGYDDNLTQRRRWALNRRLDEIRRNRDISDRDYAIAMVPVFLEFSELTDKFLVEFTLEEVAVEAILQDRFDRGELTYVSLGSYANAARYIDASHEKAERLYYAMNSVYDELRRLTSTNRLNQLYASLTKYYTARELRLSQIDAVVNRGKKSEFRLGATASLPIEDGKAATYAPCAHAEKGEKELSDLTESFRRLRSRI